MLNFVELASDFVMPPIVPHNWLVPQTFCMAIITASYQAIVVDSGDLSDQVYGYHK